MQRRLKTQNKILNIYILRKRIQRSTKPQINITLLPPTNFFERQL